MRKYLSLLTVLLSLAINIVAQTKQVAPKSPLNKRVIELNGNLKTEFDVLKSDTAIKNGIYLHYYKERVIEKGNYKNNVAVGRWQYYNLKGIFEFEYDHDAKIITALSGNRNPKIETPCLFKGSPLVPYLYIVQKVGYPKEAIDKNIKGQVVLALKIGKDGAIWAMYLTEKLHPILDSEVLKVARSFPESWQWLPATQMEEPIDSEYLVTIEFQLDE